ncbi:hypothetical protein GYA54_00115, partial [Candidatus Kuenenbacteria bacterium]|nr:hypothetical protein [Candidatus Kuenenbacteria bacterium]
MADEKPQINSQPETPGSLDIYRSSREYKVKQGFRNMTPKKKLMLLALPILVVAIGVILYFTLAAGGDPGLQLVWADTANTVNDMSLVCGAKEQKMDILVDNNVGENIVSAAAFIKYDPAKIEVTKIDVGKTDFSQGEGDTTASAPGTMQKIDNTNGLVQVVRGQPANDQGDAFTKKAGILATLYFNIKPEADISATTTIFSFSQADPNKSIIVLKGGQAVDPEYENSGNYGGIIKCCINPNDECLPYEYCPNNNWYNNDPNENIRCCREKCKQGLEFYLFEKEKTVEAGEAFNININLRPDYQPVKEINLQLKLNYYSLVEPLSSGNIIFSGGVSGTATYSNGVFAINIKNYQTTNNVAATLATMKLVAKEQGVLSVDFDPAGTGAIAVDGSKMETMGTGGVYTIVLKRIKLCPSNELVTNVGYTDVGFNLCVTPGSDCNIEIKGATSTTVVGTGISTYDGVCRANTEIDHEIQVQGLHEGRAYSYDVVCDGTDKCPVRLKYQLDESGTQHIVYGALKMSGNFTTLSSQKLDIREQKPSNVRASSATIEWNTIGGPNGDGLADSVVCYKKVGATQYETLTNANLINKHSVDIFGLEEQSKYEAYVSSLVTNTTVTRGSDLCNNPPASLCPATVPAKSCATAMATFTTKSLESSADANVILKVSKDRICDEWLYCNAKTQVKVTGANPEKYEDLCFRVGKCNKMDESGNCVSIVDEDKSAMTVESPKKVSEIRNLSGYSKVGINWGKRCLNTGRICSSDSDCIGGAKCTEAKIDGFYPYSQMAEVGVPIVIKNSNFENGIPNPWESWNKGVIENYNYENANRVLKIWPSGTFQGAIVKGVSNKTVSKGSYVVSFWAKSDDENPRDIMVELAYGPEGKYSYVPFKYYNEGSNTAANFVTLGNVWREYVVSLSAKELSGYTGQLNLVIVQAAGRVSSKPFYVDNISMKSVLELGDNMNYAARSCRLYPTETAPACDYYDSQVGKNYKGWKGYCVETDPAYQNRRYSSQPMCLMWWPVDIINGESNIFYKDPTAIGYTGRKPLYYCLEAAGNYSRTGSLST